MNNFPLVTLTTLRRLQHSDFSAGKQKKKKISLRDSLFKSDFMYELCKLPFVLIMKFDHKYETL